MHLIISDEKFIAYSYTVDREEFETYMIKLAKTQLGNLKMKLKEV